MEDVGSFIGTGLGLSVGTDVLEGLGTTTGTYGAQALGKMGARLPAMGTIKGAGWVLDELMDFTDVVKPKKKRR